MNSIEWQVTSLDLSRKLKELGVMQESYFWWVDAGIRYSEDGGMIWVPHLNGWGIHDCFPEKYDEVERCVGEDTESHIDHEQELISKIPYVSAFTVSEIYQLIYDYGYDFGIPNKFLPFLPENFY